MPVTRHVADRNIGQLWHPLGDPCTAGPTDAYDFKTLMARMAKGSS